MKRGGNARGALTVSSMAMTFKCPACGRDLEAPDGAAGQRGVCRFCHTPIIAPAAPGQPAQLDAPPQPPPRTAAPSPQTPAPTAQGWGASTRATPPGPSAWRTASGASPFAAPALPIADFWQRAVGYVVDLIVYWIVYLILHPLLNLLNPWPTGDLTSLLAGLQSGAKNPQEAASQVNLTSLLLGQLYWLIWIGIIQWLYFAVFESSSLQATPGKLVAGTKVTDMEGKRIGFGRATTRALSKGLSAALCYIGYLMAAFNDRCQTLHDMIAQTLVLKR